jgi:alpha-1,3-glucan synthase
MDFGVANEMELQQDGSWDFDLMAEWPVTLQLNEWGIDPDGNLDQTGVFGDVDGDNVLDRLPPSSLAPSNINIESTPASPYLAWKLSVNDGTYRYGISPIGNRWHQLILYILLWFIPLLTGGLGVWAFLASYVSSQRNEYSRRNLTENLGSTRSNSIRSAYQPSGDCYHCSHYRWPYDGEKIKRVEIAIRVIHL